VGVNETQTRTPVCGCDGVTYWNSSVATKNGMSIRKLGACGQIAATCGGVAGTTCPNNAKCNYRLDSVADCAIFDNAGTCWMTPAMCPQIVVGATSRACNSLSCTDECNLIKLMAPWYQDNLCPQ
jgi:hypothetical protein